MILRAADEHNIFLPESWMIGDILHDVEAGNRAGCHSVLINNGNETEWEMNEWRKPLYVAGNLSEAALQITEHSIAKRSIWNSYIRR